MADTNFAQPAILTEQSSAATPPANTVALYPKTDGRFYGKDDAGTEFAIGTIGGTVGTVDNAVPRADGTGGYTAQGSDIVIDDAVPFLSGVTGLDSTDYITVVGNTFVANQQIFFGSLTGGSALTVNTPYFVRDVGGAGANTFRISTSSGGGVQTLGSDITAGTVGAGQTNVAIVNNHVGQTNSALVLSPKGTGAFILGPKPDGTTTGGNARGANAVDLQYDRNAATQVAAAINSSILGGRRNTTGGTGYAVVAGGADNNASFAYAAILGGVSNSASGNASAIVGGTTNSAPTSFTGILSGANGIADRYGMQAHASGSFFGGNGNAQRARFVMRNKTTTNAAVELFLDGSATRLTIPSGKSVGGTIQISGVTSGGETANLYIRQFLIRNRGGTTALIGSINTIGTDIEGITAADVTLTADDTNDSLKVEVTGYTPVTGMTGTASTDVINKVAHGFNNNDDIVFTSLTGGTGLTANTVTYWVINANPDDFQVSATRGGGTVNILTDYSDMTATRVMRWVANVDCTEIGHGT